MQARLLVLDEGKVIEFGDHTGLATIKGVYYHLVKNQLELGIKHLIIAFNK